jgi:hypothetical protein
MSFYLHNFFSCGNNSFIMGGSPRKGEKNDTYPEGNNSIE